MATLALAAAGSALGGALAPAGATLFGLSGAALGSQIGGLAGSFVDQALFGSSGRTKRVAGPRLSDLTITAASEGTTIPRVYGQVRVGGAVIWGRDIEETATTIRAGGRGKGGSSGGSGAAATERTDYAYFASFAVALAEGELAGLGRVWADGQELDLTQVAFRFHAGTEDQEPDPLIAAVEGPDRAPAYRGVAYIVFERLPLAAYGNRIPQLSFEVSRAADDLARLVRGVVVIPASGEFVYAPEPVTRDGASGRIADNVHTRRAGSDWTASLDQLEAELPAAQSVSLTVGWFGDDLRAGHCRITPRVDRRFKETRPLTWRVAGLDRSRASLVSAVNGRAAYGGTPDDGTVIGAIRDLKARGLGVTLTPFLMMDIPPDSGRPGPDGAPQPAYPWRGRIRVTEAVDKTPGAAAEIAAFVGSAASGHFAINGDVVSYSGPDEWSYRRFILHHAALAKAAGGVDAFVIGSEMRGLTTSRSGPATYPFVAALVALAADVKAMLGASTKVTYAADWTEYFGHQPADGSWDVQYHLDPLWAAPAIDAVGIDAYWPLADWRDGDHADARAGARAIHDLDYLKANLSGGEGYDWYYVSDADRVAQVRRPITDGVGKPWVFRPKDVKSWWQNLHHNRTAGGESRTPTAWVPESKPVWLMEIGCPAVDKGANQPNVFVDPKSSESSLPWFSDGRRDDLMQRRYLRAVIEALTPGHPGAVPALNPVSSVYGGPMVPPERIHVYCWDARPWPAFPADTDTWGDAPHWRLGHWITGRLARAGLGETVATLLADYGVTHADTRRLAGIVPGYVVDRIMSARDALEPLELAYFFDAVESGDRLRFQHRDAESPHFRIDADDLVEPRPGAPLLTLARTEESELPSAAKLSYLAPETEYRRAVAEARRPAKTEGRVGEAHLPLVLDTDQATAVAESWLHEAWAARETARFTLPPSRLGVEPGDIVDLATAAGNRLFRVVAVGDHGARDIEARSFDPNVYHGSGSEPRPTTPPAEVAAGPPTVLMLDLPALPGATGYVGRIAALADPWPGPLAVWRSGEASGFELIGRITRPAILGRTASALARGPIGRIDQSGSLTITLDGPGALASVTPLALLGGANSAAVAQPDGTWEVLQFERAELEAPGRWRLSRLLRGQAGTEHRVADLLAAGARFVLLDEAILRMDLAVADLARPWRWRIGPALRDIGHPDFLELAGGFAGTSLVPRSPVHARARRRNGAIEVTWVRQTRVDGDGWEAAEVPLGEEREAYRVEVLTGDRVVRIAEVTVPRFTYTDEDAEADTGAPRPTLRFRIAQTSAVRGPGPAIVAAI